MNLKRKEILIPLNKIRLNISRSTVNNFVHQRIELYIISLFTHCNKNNGTVQSPPPKSITVISPNRLL